MRCGDDGGESEHHRIRKTNFSALSQLNHFTHRKLLLHLRRMAVLLLRVRRLEPALFRRVVGRDGLLPAVVFAELVDQALVVLPALDRVPVVEKVGQIDARNVPGRVEDPAKSWFVVSGFFEFFVQLESSEPFGSPQIKFERTWHLRSIRGVARRTARSRCCFAAIKK